MFSGIGGQMDEIPTFVPGDQIVYVVCFTYPANMQAVSATFRNESTGAEPVLWGDARLLDEPRVLGTRLHAASLGESGGSGRLEAGRYRLIRLEAESKSTRGLVSLLSRCKARARPKRCNRPVHLLLPAGIR
jgi:hypothetical protein